MASSRSPETCHVVSRWCFLLESLPSGGYRGSTMTRFKLLALDLDGTLVGPDSLVSEPNRQAISMARAAGLAVCLATGRSYPESRGIWGQLRLQAPHEPIVTVGGAMVCQSDTGRTLYHRSIDRDVARRFGAAMNDSGCVAMALVDGWRHGTAVAFAARTGL